MSGHCRPNTFLRSLLPKIPSFCGLTNVRPFSFHDTCVPDSGKLRACKPHRAANEVPEYRSMTTTPPTLSPLALRPREAALMSAIGMKLADLFAAQANPTPSRNVKPKPDGKMFPTPKDAVADLERQHGKRSAMWTYHDAQAELIGLVVRWDKPSGKDLRPV